jgi:hypothetical protein
MPPTQYCRVRHALALVIFFSTTRFYGPRASETLIGTPSIRRYTGGGLFVESHRTGTSRSAGGRISAELKLVRRLAIAKTALIRKALGGRCPRRFRGERGVV